MHLALQGLVGGTMSGCRFCDAYQELLIIDEIVYVDIKHDPDCYSVKHDGALIKGEYRKHAKQTPPQYEGSSVTIDTRDQWLRFLTTAKMRGEAPSDALANLLDAYINDWEWKD